MTKLNRIALALMAILGFCVTSTSVYAQKKTAKPAPVSAQPAPAPKPPVDWVAVKSLLTYDPGFAREMCCDCDKSKIGDVLVGSPAIDELTRKSCDLAATDMQITHDIEFLKVEYAEIPDDGSGVTQEIRISNGKGEKITPANAIVQLTDLSLKVVRVANDVVALQQKTSAASAEVSDASMFKKASYGSSFKNATNVLQTVLSETGKQTDKVSKQISALKMLNSF